MSDATIRKGDLVMVVRAPGCCADAEKYIGRLFVVAEIAARSNVECSSCATQSEHGECAKTGLISPRGKWIGYRTSWLKKIPPLTSLEGQQTEEPTRIEEGSK